MLIKTLDWLVENGKRLPFLFQWAFGLIFILTCSIPLVLLVVFWLKSEGYIESPITSRLNHSSSREGQMLMDHMELTKSMVQLNDIATEFHVDQEEHARDTRRLMDMFQFVVVENCVEHNPSNLKKCEMLERRLERRN